MAGNPLLRTLRRAADVVRRARPTSRPSRPARPGAPARPGGGATPSYAPRADGLPDPGEVVWAWVPFEDDPAQGKDRPVLLLARDGDAWLGLGLTSKDHDRDTGRQAAAGRHWMDVGAGGWDRQGRPSEVRLDRLLRLRPDAIRREGAALPRPVFDRVVAAAREHHRFA